MVMTRHGRRGGAWVLALGVALAGTTGCRGDAVPADGEDESGSSGPGSDPDAGDDTQGQTDDAGDETQGESDTDDPPSPEDAVPPPGGLRRGADLFRARGRAAAEWVTPRANCCRRRHNR